MAYAHHQNPRIGLDSEIIPTAIMIKNIPLDWSTGQLLHFMTQMKLPLPGALSFLKDNLGVFRGMAFADFASAAEARQVICEMDFVRVPGRRLNVQYKRKRAETIAREQFTRKSCFQPSHYSHSSARGKAFMHPQAKLSSASDPIGEQTQSAESYDLLMNYQTDPAEKEMLRCFLAQTGNYQEAVNEFAKNRAREVQEDIFRRSVDMENGTVLEMRSATLCELEEIADMETQFGLAGGVGNGGEKEAWRKGDPGQ